MDSENNNYIYRIATTTDTIKTIVSQRINTFFIGFPKSGIKRTISESFSKLGYSDLLAIVDISLYKSIDLTEILNQLFSKNNNNLPMFFLIENLDLLSADGLTTYQLIEKLRKQYQKNTNLIYHFNLNPFWYGLPDSTRQLYYFPCSSELEFSELTDFFCSRFDKKLDQSQKNIIYHITGGHPYLTKKVFELDLVTSPKSEMIDHLVPIGLHLLDSLPVTEVIRLKNISNQDIDFKNHYNKLGIIDKHDNIISQVVSAAITTFKTSQKLSIDYPGQQIALGGVSINSYFAPHEQKLLFSLSQEKTISRDRLIEICWPSSHQVISDSAIDKLISRFRQKCTDIGLSKKIINTSRGRGYSLNYDST